MRDVATLGDRIDLKRAAAFTPVASAPPLPGSGVEPPLFGPLAHILNKARGSERVYDVAYQYNQMRWEFFHNEWQAGSRYAAAYADHVIGHLGEFSADEVSTAEMYVRHLKILAATADADNLNTVTDMSAGGSYESPPCNAPRWRVLPLPLSAIG